MDGVLRSEPPQGRLFGPHAESISLAGLIRAAAAERPDAVALRFDTAQITYEGLQSEAERLAARLCGMGADRGVVVGVVLERSPARVASLLAIMMSGAAFLPLDPAWPAAHLQHVLADADARILIGDAAATPAALRQGRLFLDPAEVGADGPPPHREVQPDDLAYVVYTSGSTGVPKGVEITHGNLLSLIRWHCSAFDIGPGDRGSHLAGLGFDAAIWEVWPYLAVGASVALAPEDCRTDWHLLRDWLVAARVTVGFVPTVLATPMITAPWTKTPALRLLLTGSEALLAYPHPQLPFAVINNYGPTECSVVAISGRVPPLADAGTPPALGYPIMGTQIFLLDENLQPVPPGAGGEICIAGAGVGRGYRNRPELTARCFIDTPMGRLYRSGDLGVALPDGRIQFGGRRDEQEKIRGHRIEPGEISAALNRHPRVAASAVVGRENPAGERILVAYVIPSEAGEPDAAALREHLEGLLPRHMLPAAFVRLAAFPLTASGKLDRAALPEPGPENTPGALRGRAPDTITEQRIAAILGRLLGVETIGAEDNFFLLGGHSLLATQLVLQAREAFGVELTLLQLFEAPTVAQLAQTIEAMLVSKLAAMSEAEIQQLAAR